MHERIFKMQHSVVMAFMDTILQYSALVSFTFSTWKCKSSLWNSETRWWMCIWKHSFLILAVLHSIYFDISTEVHILLFDSLSIPITPSKPSATFQTYSLIFLPTPKADDEAVLNPYVDGNAGCDIWCAGKTLIMCQSKKMTDNYLLRNSYCIERF